jgi:hypothetical protein
MVETRLIFILVELQLEGGRLGFTFGLVSLWLSDVIHTSYHVCMLNLCAIYASR